MKKYSENFNLSFKIDKFATEPTCHSHVVDPSSFEPCDII